MKSTESTEASAPRSELLTVSEAAQEFRVTERTIRNWITAGLPVLQPGGPAHSVRIERRELLRERTEQER